jgi:hypothetical protein
MMTKRHPNQTVRQLAAGSVALAVVALQAACGQAQQRDTQAPLEDVEAAYEAELSTLDASLEDSSLALAGTDEDLSGEASDLEAGVVSSDEASADEPGRVTRTCVDDPEAGVTTVTSVRKNEINMSRPRLFGRRATGAATVSFETTRIWSKNGESLGCNATGDWALVDKRNMDGVTLRISFKRSVDVEASRTSPSSDGLGLQASAESSGERVLSYAQSESDGSITHAITIESKVTRSVGGQAGERSASGSLEIKTGSEPLLVKVKRDASSFDVQSRTIESGQLVTTRGNGARLESTFKNLAFEKKDGCAGPVSGEISSVHVGPNGKDRDINVTFAAGSAAIVVQTGDEIREFSREWSCQD